MCFKIFIVSEFFLELHAPGVLATQAATRAARYKYRRCGEVRRCASVSPPVGGAARSLHCKIRSLVCVHPHTPTPLAASWE